MLKSTSRIFVAFVCLGGLMGSAHAGPVGPSAKKAAELKKHPTSAWLAHYLPDDRYKIAGGVWKFVSTDLDTYYHNPQSPLMMRQSADRVIGFASSQEAEDAGYQAAPGTVMDAPKMPSGMAMVVGTGGRITLGDGYSTVVLPKGWHKGAGVNLDFRGGHITMDMITNPAGQNIAIGIVRMPSNLNIDLGAVFNVNTIKQSQANWSQAGGFLGGSSLNSAFSPEKFSKDFGSMKFAPFKLKGLEGVVTNTPGGMSGSGRPVRQYLFGKGNRMFIVTVDNSVKGNGGAKMDPNSVVKSIEFGQ